MYIQIWEIRREVVDTLCHAGLLCAPGTSSRCSCSTASTSRIPRGLPSPSSCHCGSTPSFSQGCRVPRTKFHKLQITSSLRHPSKFYNAFHQLLTCKIVSKLNVSPFHNVNSPELAPVTSLLPSGVHAMQNMGHLILLVAVFTKRVVTQLMGLSG